MTKPRTMEEFVAKWLPKIAHTLPPDASPHYVAWCLMYTEGHDGTGGSPHMTQVELAECATDYVRLYEQRAFSHKPGLRQAQNVRLAVQFVCLEARRRIQAIEAEDEKLEAKGRG